MFGVFTMFKPLGKGERCYAHMKQMLIRYRLVENTNTALKEHPYIRNSSDPNVAIVYIKHYTLKDTQAGRRINSFSEFSNKPLCKKIFASGSKEVHTHQEKESTN